VRTGTRHSKRITPAAAVARHFIPRGRALARSTGAEWPEALEAATVGYVEDAIGCIVPRAPA
jgi:hypothetical protein